MFRVIRFFEKFSVSPIGLDSTLGRILREQSIGLIKVSDPKEANVILTDQRADYLSALGTDQVCVICNGRSPRTDYSRHPNVRRISGAGDELFDLMKELCTVEF